MLLLTESNALTLWNDCTYNAGAMLRLNVRTRRAALLEQVGQTKRVTGVSRTNKVYHRSKSGKQNMSQEQVGQTKYVTLLDVAFPLHKRGTPRPYICRFPIFVGFDKKLAASMKRKGMKGALKRVSP